MSLVPIPWQPSLMVHSDLLARLRAVGAIMGRPPYLFGPNSAWRSYAQQKALWDAYQNGTGNIASNPDTGNRTHMRGVAADLLDTSLAMQRACVRAGLQRDPAEAWHWQLPNWRDYPIIKELPPPVEPEQTEDTDMRPVAFQRTTNPSEWMLAAPWLVGPGNQQGYIVTTDVNRGTAWLRMYARGAGSNGVDRDGYIAIQEAARELRAQWLAAGAVDVPAAAADAILKDDFAAVRADVNKPRTLQ